MAAGIKVINGDTEEGRLMYSRIFGVHGTIGALVAVAILGISALVLDRAYLFSAPGGIVEVDQPTLVTALDEVVVSGSR
jgi:hypothetical protein